MANECVRDVEEGVHALVEGCAGDRDDEDERLTARELATVCGRGIWVWVVSGCAMLAFYAGEGGCENDADEREACRGKSALGQHLKGTWQRADEGDAGPDDGEVDGAHAVICHRVEVAGNRQDVKSLNEGIVQQEHDRSEPVGDVAVPEEHLANVCHISNLGVSEAEFPVCN